MKYRQINRKRFLLLSVVVFVICGIALGYAALSSSFKISGTGTISTNWDILFTSIEEKSSKGAVTNHKEITDKLTATFDVNIEAPGNYIEYNVVIKNNGNIDAVIESIQGIVEANEQEPTGIQFGVSGIRIGADLLAGSEKTFVVRAEISSSAITLPTGTKTLDLKVNVRQKDIDSSGLVTTFKDCFQTNEAGDTITKYLCGKDNTNGYSEILDVTIPREINGVTITKIGTGSFSNQSLTSVVFPDTITVIGDAAFSYNKLSIVEFPNSTRHIGYDAFICNQLTKIVIPNDVTSLGTGAFRNNKVPLDQAFIYNRNSDGTKNRASLNSYAGADRDRVVLPEGITMIGTNAFNGCQIKQVTLPSQLQIIHSSAFFSNALTEITFPETLTDIRANAFSANKLTNLMLPRNLTVLETYAFTNNMLTGVTFLGNVPADLGINVFQNNTYLTAGTIQVPRGKLVQYQTAQGKSNSTAYTSARTWFGSDDDSLLDAFYE